MAEIEKGRKKSRVHNSISEFCSVSLLAASIKILLIPSYYSTDFEVHRHWLALTHSLPIQKWYLDETSPWTLDYPPFFAYFERFLSIFARVIDPQIVDLHKGLNYNAKSVIYFQRVSVIASDLVLLLGVFLLTRNLNFRKRFLIWCLVILSPSLIIVDHVHFQYNGFLIGILLISIWCLESGRDLLGGFTFAVLLCFKHLFAVAAPVYFVYLLKHYCWKGGLVSRVRRVSKLGSLVVFVFTLAFGPFLYHGQAREVMRRMFPFGRGLCHAYWAPNFWALYIILDKVAASLLRKLGFEIKKPEASFTGGLVGDSSPFSLLPQISPSITLVIVLLAMFPCLVKIWTETRPRRVIRWISYAYTCGFMFGWHVHEKASLHFVIPLAFVAVDSSEDAKHHFITSIVCTYSIFPLLHGVQEYPVKILLLLCHSVAIFLCFSSYFFHKHSREVRKEKAIGGFHLNCMEKGYLWGIVAVESLCMVIHPLFFTHISLPFIPLMLTSVYSTIGITYSWLWQLRRILSSPDFT